MYKETKESLIEEGMEPQAIKAFLKLQNLDCPVKTWYQSDRGHFWIDAEQPGAEQFLEYWHNPTGSDKLNNILNKHGFFFEWTNPGYACIYNI